MIDGLKLFAIFAFLTLFIIFSCSKSEECERKGGVFFQREFKCVRGVEEIR